MDDGLVCKTVSDTHEAVIAVQEQLEKVSQCCLETSPVGHPQQQNSRTSSASSLIQSRSHNMLEQSQIPQDPLQQNANVQDAGQMNKTKVQERAV